MAPSGFFGKMGSIRDAPVAGSSALTIRPLPPPPPPPRRTKPPAATVVAPITLPPAVVVSDLVRDSQLDATFSPDFGTTTHVRNRPVTITPQRQQQQNSDGGAAVLVVRVARCEEKWQRRRQLGTGTYGTVWLEECVDCTPTEPDGRSRAGDLRAVKEIRKVPGEGARLTEEIAALECRRELEAIAKFSHEKYVHCFVRSFGWFESAVGVFIAMEYARFGDLQRYLDLPFPEAETRRVVLQVVEGLKFMHDNGFAHRDLKPGNILVFALGPAWWVKIGDFGITKRVEGLTLLRTEIGTMGFMAPEVLGIFCLDEPHDLKDYSYTTAVDIWAVGEIAFRLLTGRTSFSHQRQLFDYVVRSQEFPMKPLTDTKHSADSCDFIKQAMTASPSQRLTANAALAHPWLENLYEDDASNENQELKQQRAAQVEERVPRSVPQTEASARWTTISSSADKWMSMDGGDGFSSDAGRPGASAGAMATILHHQEADALTAAPPSREPESTEAAKQASLPPSVDPELTLEDVIQLELPTVPAKKKGTTDVLQATAEAQSLRNKDEPKRLFSRFGKFVSTPAPGNPYGPLAFDFTEFARARKRFLENEAEILKSLEVACTVLTGPELQGRRDNPVNILSMPDATETLFAMQTKLCNEIKAANRRDKLDFSNIDAQTNPGLFGPHGCISTVGQALCGLRARMREDYLCYVRAIGFGFAVISNLRRSPRPLGWLADRDTEVLRQTGLPTIEALLVRPLLRLLTYPETLASLTSTVVEDHPDALLLRSFSAYIEKELLSEKILHYVDAGPQGNYSVVSGPQSRMSTPANSWAAFGLRQSEHFQIMKLAESLASQVDRTMAVIGAVQVYKGHVRQFADQFKGVFRTASMLMHLASSGALPVVDGGHRHSPSTLATFEPTKYSTPAAEKWGRFSEWVDYREDGFRVVGQVGHVEVTILNPLHELSESLRRVAPAAARLDRLRTRYEAAALGHGEEDLLRKLDRKYSSSATALKSRATALLELSPKLIELCLLSFARFQATWFAEWMAHVPRIFNVEHQHKFVSESKLCRVPDVGEIVEAYNRNPPPQALTLFGEPSPTREPVSRGPDVQVHEAAEPAKKEAAIEYFPQYSLVASLFQFSNSRDVYEDGYPWLSYEPGEVFELVGRKGDNWLARQHSDSKGGPPPAGWIWSKHFARLVDP